ncbi:hypothetical protein ACX0G7_25950 [Flavitalea antarctica]
MTTITPYITIYSEENINLSWIGDCAVRATLIFSKNLDYNKSLFRKRVNIHLSDEERAHSDFSIKSIWIKNKIDTSLDLSDEEKIGFFLKIICDSLMTIAEIEGWETNQFDKAYKLSVADKGNFVWYSQLKTNKNRNLKARVKISFDKDGKVPIIAEFFGIGPVALFEVTIIDTFLHFVDWERIFEKPRWLDNERFGFNLLNSQLRILANFSSRQSETIISETSWSREQIEGRLRSITFSRFANNKEYVEWANK